MNRDTQTFHSNTLLRPILIVCTLLMLIIVAAAMPPVPYFSQCDSRWSGDRLGGDGPTICDAGCALTSAAMVMAYYGVDTDPQKLNNAIGRAGYDANYYIYWSAVRNVCHDEINQIEYSPGTVKPFDTTVLNNQLDARHPVIVNVDGHFVVVTGRSDGTYYINDPISSAKSTLDAYPNRVGMHIYSGNPPDINKPLVGDWNGNGTDTTGIYNYTTANFSLDSGLNISFGISGDIPITGGWNGDGYDTIGVFRPSTAQFFLDYDNDAVSDMNTTFGVIGDIPIVGDWDGDGDDNIGVFRPNHSDTGLTMFFLDFDNSGGSADQSVAFGEPDDLPVIGDWDGDGDDNIGLYRPGSTTGVFYLDIDNDGGTADVVTPEYGDLGDIPIAGDWDGDSDDNIGVYRPGTGEFFMDATLPEVSSSKTIYVNDAFSDDPAGHRWDTIQEGVDDADAGDTVIVYAGVYVENVDVNKSITLEGAGADVVTVTAASAYDHVFEITADYVNISGFTVTGTTYWGTGIYLIDVNHCNIFDNNASKNKCYGIYLYGSHDNTLMNNTANSNYHGIRLYHSNNNMLQDNTVSNNIDLGDRDSIYNGDGICLYHSNNNTLQNNMASSNDASGIDLSSSSNNTLANNAYSNNGIGVNFHSSSNNTLANNTFINNGLSADQSYRNIVKNNTVNGRSLVYFEDTSNFTIQNAGQVVLVNCTNITVENLNLSNASIGIELWETDDCKLVNNRVSNNTFGICVGCSSNNTLADNIASHNDCCGIYLWYSNNSTITDNIANSNNRCGIYMYSSSSNTLQSNNCSNNDYCSIRLWYSCNNMLTNNNASNNSNGIYLRHSSNYNTLHHNNLINNTNHNAYDSCTNTWDSGSVGNYYSDYTGTDNDTDGIGEDPYQIPGGGGGIDHYPLMQPWTPIDVTTPDFCLEDAISGKTICLSNYSNKVVLLNFMTIWCPWCQKEADDILVPLHNQYYANDSKVAFLSIDIGDSTTQQLRAYAEQHNINFSILTYGRTSGVAEDYGIMSVPTTVIVICKGTERTVYNTYFGYCPDGLNTFYEWIEEAKKLIPSGDLNGDDEITPTDAAIALQIAVGGSASCDPAMLAAADVSGDNCVTSLDALMILQAAAGAIEL